MFTQSGASHTYDHEIHSTTFLDERPSSTSVMLRGPLGRTVPAVIPKLILLQKFKYPDCKQPVNDDSMRHLFVIVIT